VWLTATLRAILPWGSRTEDLGYITLTQAAERYGVPRGTLKTAAHAGRLPARLVGRMYLVRPADVEVYRARLNPRPTRRKETER
jgi:excisionase family DNA binding protein